MRGGGSGGIDNREHWTQFLMAVLPVLLLTFSRTVANYGQQPNFDTPKPLLCHQEEGGETDKTRLQPLHRFSFGGIFRHVLQAAPLIAMTGVLNSSDIDISSCMKRL
jgi:hypothetical protein